MSTSLQGDVRPAAAFANLSATSFPCGDSANGNLIVALQDLVVGPHRRDGVGLARTEGIGSYPLNGCGGVGEEGVATAAPVASADDAECLVYGEDLCIENPLVVAEVVAATDPASR